MNLTKDELQARLHRLIAAMDRQDAAWDSLILVSKIHQYYLTGTMQDGMLILRKGGDHGYFVRKGIERARQEGLFAPMFAIDSYRDIAKQVGDLGKTYMETEVVTLSMLERMKKAMNMGEICSADRLLLNLRAVKTPYERYWQEQSGRAHDTLLRQVVPTLLKEGIREADFSAQLFAKMVELGHQGVSRFGMFQTEMLVGQIGFGENSVAPTSFDGPGGNRGICAAANVLGDPARRLKKGDRVFVDVAFGMQGMQTDKTQVFVFGGKVDDAAKKAQEQCRDILKRVQEALKVGAIPSQIYQMVLNMAGNTPNFMGFDGRAAKFIGHGVGLLGDEYPVLAKGFDAPLQENMVIAVEPKIGFADGMVGVEETFVVTQDGGRCLTGGDREIVGVG